MTYEPTLATHISEILAELYNNDPSKPLMISKRQILAVVDAAKIMSKPTYGTELMDVSDEEISFELQNKHNLFMMQVTDKFNLILPSNFWAMLMQDSRKITDSFIRNVDSLK